MFPLSVLLNPLNNTMNSIVCDMVDYDEVQKDKQHGYFKHEGVIKCHPLEEDMHMTQKKIKDCSDRKGLGPSLFFGTIIIDRQYPDGVMVFSVDVHQDQIHAFYVPLRNFVSPCHWPGCYKNCYLPFRNS